MLQKNMCPTLYRAISLNIVKSACWMLQMICYRSCKQLVMGIRNDEFTTNEGSKGGGGWVPRPPLWTLHLSKTRRKVLFKWSQIFMRPFVHHLNTICIPSSWGPLWEGPRHLCLHLFCIFLGTSRNQCYTIFNGIPLWGDMDNISLHPLAVNHHHGRKRAAQG